MRIVITCDWFLKYAAAQSAALARAGGDVALLCRSHAHEFGDEAAERAAALQAAAQAGVEIMTIPGRLTDPRAAPDLVALRRRLGRWQPDVVHAHEGADPRALALLPATPVVLTVHDPAPHPGQPVPPLRKRWFLYGARNAWRRRAALIVVHSESLLAAMPARAGQTCVVLPHGLDVLARPLPPPPEPRVVFFGRLVAYKGLDVLARAMPRVWETRPEVRLSVAGAGPSPFPLEDPRVELAASYLPEAELAEFFARASLSVLPYTEASQTGAGSVAVGFGVPVVVSRVGGLPDLALDPSYVVAPGDHRGLAAAVLAHVDDDASVRGRVMREVAAPRSWDAVAQRSLEHYERLVGGP